MTHNPSRCYLASPVCKSLKITITFGSLLKWKYSYWGTRPSQQQLVQSNSQSSHASVPGRMNCIESPLTTTTGNSSCLSSSNLEKELKLELSSRHCCWAIPSSFLQMSSSAIIFSSTWTVSFQSRFLCPRGITPSPWPDVGDGQVEHMTTDQEGNVLHSEVTK